MLWGHKQRLPIRLKIIEKKGDYVLALKANHPTLYTQVQQWFETAQAPNFHCVDVSYAKGIETGHHRREMREVWTVPATAIPQLYQPKIWAGLHNSNAPLIGQAIRRHWGIENQAHGTLDCTFAEDACRIALSTVRAILLFYDVLE